MVDCHLFSKLLGDIPISSDTFDRLLIELAKSFQIVKLADSCEPSIKRCYIWSCSNDFCYIGWFRDERLH